MMEAFTIEGMISGQFYNATTFVKYDSRVVIYERKMFIRLATEKQNFIATYLAGF